MYNRIKGKRGGDRKSKCQVGTLIASDVIGGDYGVAEMLNVSERSGRRTDLQPSANLREVSQSQAANIANLGLGANQHEASANLQTQTRAEAANIANLGDGQRSSANLHTSTRAQAAEMLNVSERSGRSFGDIARRGRSNRLP